MEDFDEFGVYSLPSDPPTRADDIAIVREAAARDPKVREFLQRIRSRTESVAVRARIQEALAEGHPGIGAFKDLVAAKQENEEARKRAEESTAAVEQMSQQVSGMVAKSFSQAYFLTLFQNYLSKGTTYFAA